MITYEDAKKLALQYEPSVNTCLEYDKGYFFFEKTDIDKDDDSGIAIVKETGEAMSWMTLITEVKPSPKFKVFEDI